MNSTAIIDLDSVMFSIGNPNKVLDENNEPLRIDNKFVYEDKTPDQLVDSCEFIMNKILNSCKCTDYIAYIKGKGNYRYDIKSDYKANRPKESPSWWKFVKGYLIENWKAIEVNGIEVDDAVNITRLQVPNSFIVAIDGDLLGLEGTHYNWRKNDLMGEWITTNKEQAEYKFWSDMICGQKGDNIDGLRGKGEAFVKKLFAPIQVNDLLKYPTYHTDVLNTYIEHYKDFTLALDEYYKNYNCLKILDKYEGFIIPESIKFKGKKDKISEEKGIFD